MLSTQSNMSPLKKVIYSSGPPLDYSFMELTSIMEIENEDPRSGTRKRSPNSPQKVSENK